MIHKSAQHAKGRVFYKHEILIIFNTLPQLFQDSIMISNCLVLKSSADYN